MTTKDRKPGLLIYVRSDQLGDALLKLPVISSLRDAFPGYHITWFSGCGKSVFNGPLKPLINNMVDSIEDSIELGKHWHEFLRPVPFSRSQDIIIDTQHIVRSSLLLKRISHELYISPAAGFYFSDKKPDDRDEYKGSVQDKLVYLVQLASGKEITIDYKLQLDNKYTQAAAELLPAGKYIGFAPGAGDRRKCWPLDRYIEVANRVSNIGVPVFFLGPDELSMLEKIKSEVPGALFPEQFNDTPGLNGPLLALALARRLTAGLANDSGTGHILATAKCPLVSLFGITDPEKFVGRQDNRISIRASDHAGTNMKNIPVSVVIDALVRLCNEG